MPAPIDWIIFALGCIATIVVFFQRRAIKERDREQVETLGLVLLLMSYLEVQARAAKDRPGNRASFTNREYDGVNDRDPDR